MSRMLAGGPIEFDGVENRGYVPPASTRKMQSSARDRWRARVQGWTAVTFHGWTYGVLVGEEQRCFPPGPAHLPGHVARELSEQGYLTMEGET